MKNKTAIFPISALDTVFQSAAAFVDNARRIESRPAGPKSINVPMTCVSYPDFIMTLGQYNLSAHSIADAFDVPLPKVEQWVRGQRLLPPEVAWYFVPGRWDALRERLLERGESSSSATLKSTPDATWFEWRYDGKAVDF